MKLGVYKRIGNAIRVGGSQLMRKVSIELERDKKMCSETLSSIWGGNAPLQEQSVETLCILFDYLSRHADMNGDVKAITIKAVATSGKLYRMMERITKRNESVLDALTAEFGAKLDNTQKADMTLMCAVYAKAFYGDDSIMNSLNGG